MSFLPRYVLSVKSCVIYIVSQLSPLKRRDYRQLRGAQRNSLHRKYEFKCSQKPGEKRNKQIDVLMSMHDDEKCTRNEMKLAPAPAKNFLPTCPWCRWMLSTLCIQSFYRVRTDDYEFLISSKHDTNRILKMMPPNDGCAIVLITENLRKIIDEKIGTRFNSFTIFWFLGLLIERSEDEKLSELRSMINGLTIVCVCWASSEWFSGMIRAGIREEIPEIATQKF